MEKFFTIKANSLLGEEDMKDWTALFDWLQHSGLSVGDIYEAVRKYKHEQEVKEREARREKEFMSRQLNFFEVKQAAG